MKDLLLRLVGTASLAGICGLAIWSVSLSNGPSDEALIQKETAPLPQDARPGNATSVQARSDIYYSALFERPLFSDTRRPRVLEREKAPEPEAIAPSEAPKPPPLPQVALHGVMADGARTRVLISVEGAAPIWLSDGEKIGGWTISKAGVDWLEVTAGNQKIRLDLFE